MAKSALIVTVVSLAVASLVAATSSIYVARKQNEAVRAEIKARYEEMFKKSDEAEKASWVLLCGSYGVWKKRYIEETGIDDFKKLPLTGLEKECG